MAGIWEQAQQTCELGPQIGNKLNKLENSYGHNLATYSIEFCACRIEGSWVVSQS